MWGVLRGNGAPCCRRAGERERGWGTMTPPLSPIPLTYLCALAGCLSLRPLALGLLLLTHTTGAPTHNSHANDLYKRSCGVGVGGYAGSCRTSPHRIFRPSPTSPPPPHLCTLAGCLRLRGALALCLLLHHTPTQRTHTQACKNTTRLSERESVRCTRVKTCLQHTHARTRVTVRCSNKRATGAARAGAHEAHGCTHLCKVAEGGIRHGAECGRMRGS